MPLLLTRTSQPFTTNSAIELASVYAIITLATYDTDAAKLLLHVAYYVSEAARAARAAPLTIAELPVAFAQVATAQEVNQVGIFSYVEQLVAQQLGARLGEGVTIEPVA